MKGPAVRGSAVRGSAGRGVAAWRAARRAVSRRRRLLAAGLAAAAVALGISAVAPPPPQTVTVLVAARELTGGTAVGGDDVAEIELPAAVVPEGAVRPGDAIEGRLLASPVRRGEPLTDVRLVGPALVRGFGTGMVAAPVRIADPGAVALLRAGDVVDVLAADETLDVEGGGGGTGPARVVAPAVRVLALPAPTGDEVLGAGQSGEGALVVLATSDGVAAELARAAVTARLSVTLRPA